MTEGQGNQENAPQNLSELMNKDIDARLGWIVRMPPQEGKIMLAAAIPISRANSDFEQQILDVIAYRYYHKKGKAPWMGPQEEADKKSQIELWLKQQGVSIDSYLAKFDADVPQKFVYDTVLGYINGELDERFRTVARELIYEPIGNYIKGKNPTLEHYDSTKPDKEIEVETEKFTLRTSIKRKPIISLEEFLQDRRTRIEDFYGVISDRSPEEIERENERIKNLSKEGMKQLLESEKRRTRIEQERMAGLWQTAWTPDADCPLNLLLAQVYTPANAAANAKCSIPQEMIKLVDLKGVPLNFKGASTDYASTKTVRNPVGNLQYDIFHLWNFRKEFMEKIIEETAKDVQRNPSQDLKDIESIIKNGYESRDPEVWGELRLKALEMLSQDFIKDLLKSGYKFNFLDTTPFSPLLVWDKDCSRLIVLRPYAENYHFSEFESEWHKDKKLARTERQMKDDFFLRNTYYSRVNKRTGLGLTQVISVEADDEEEARKQLQMYSLTNIFGEVQVRE